MATQELGAPQAGPRLTFNLFKERGPLSTKRGPGRFPPRPFLSVASSPTFPRSHAAGTKPTNYT